MDQSRANNITACSSREGSGGRLSQATTPSTPLQQFDAAHRQGLMMDRWMKETPKNEPYHGLVVTEVDNAASRP
ncbi:hypothetical protein FVEN_g12735 [Fusarium venenatum]|uniref:Uncharacterized protein n=1 Tax=Fusarium venenatum TaxID=56646 RepID=A0A2L2TI53_9HYPO|nr:uncharacterized protein FVRRES_13923 [Fusarium venenatum]KAG8358638.1 hypothetical protein FVEN_g12735 [Fusarium venenatum]KAH6980322.1 hypothetical protein EDB82DRAFT_510565 [Fusarium venenatum]CEI42175.1 unnamed protein product [Fusarium venenatum]